MKTLILISISLLLSSCSVFKPYLCDHNYGDDKYYRELRDQKAANCYKRMGLIP